MKTKRILSIALTLVMLLGMLPGMNLTAYAANNLTIYIMDMLENMDDNEWGYQLYDGDVSIAEGTYVQINMGTWHTGVMNIYMNGEVVYTKPSGSLYKDDVYHFTAGPNCKILGGYQNMFDWDGNPNVYITQDASVAVTGVTLNPNTAQTIDVGGSVAFTATVEPAGASDKTVKWSVGGTNADAVKLYSDSACTTEVGADATDKLTVYAKGESAGSATVTATSNADSTKSASCDVTVNAAQTQTEELLTTITAVGASNASTATSANVSYSTEDIATLTFSQVTPDGYGRVSYVPTWGWWGYGITLTVTPADGYTITKCVFYDDANRTATDSEAPFVVETAEEGDKAPKVNGTPILAYTSKGIKKIEVYGYATPTATHSVTITPGDNMTKTAGSGDAEQTGLTGAMTDVVYTADNGYYYPTDYSVAEVSGIKVTRDSYTQITVSGTPTADAAIALTAPTAKTTPDAPTTAAATDCTTADNNDGKLTGVTTAMEYKKSDADSWTAGTGSDITDLVPGTYYVRIKATDTTNASANQELTIKGFISYTVTFKVVNGKWNEGEGDAATADKTVTLTGHDGDTLKLTADQIPAVGSKSNDTYKAGSWDTTPSANTAITAETTYTYTYAQKDAAVVTKAPEAKTLTYTGSAQELVTAGTATGGEMQYALGTKDAATQPYTTSIPTATEAGTYYVWYKVVGDDAHADSEAKCITVTISEALKIEFKANGGTGTMDDQKVTKNETTKLKTHTFTREDHSFKDWNTREDGSGTSYSDNAEVTLNENLILYAQWSKVEKHNHNFEKVEAVEAGCESDGNKSYYRCTDENCDEWYEDASLSVRITDKSSVILKATGHKWDKVEITKEATYDEEGIRTYICSVCGETKTESIKKKERPSSYDDSDDSSSDDSDSGSSSSSGSSSKRYTEAQAKVDQINNVSTYSIPENHQVESGVPASDIGGRWGNNANADTWTYTKSDGTLAKSEWMSLDYNGLRYWYYFNEDGNMQTNWFDYKGERFYLMPEKDGWRGRMATGWKNIDNKWYYFDIVPGSSQGRLYRSSVTPDGHTVGADGAWNGVGATPVGQK